MSNTLLIFRIFAFFKSHILNAGKTGGDPLCPFKSSLLLLHIKCIEVLTNSPKSNISLKITKLLLLCFCWKAVLEL